MPAPGVEGHITRSELAWGERGHPSDQVGPGDTFAAMVLAVDLEKGIVNLSRKQAVADPFIAFGQGHAVGDDLEGDVRNVTKVGAFIEVEPGVVGLIPRRELAWVPVVDPLIVIAIDERVQVRILELIAESRQLKLSRRPFLQNPTEAFIHGHSVGDRLTGSVKKLMQVGAVVDLGGGVDGFLHVSELAWHRVETPSDILTDGQEVTVEIVTMDQAGRQVKVSLKRLTPPPIDDFIARTPLGTQFPAKVDTIKDFGAFVELGPGVSGLVHISKMAAYRVGHPSEVVQVGATVTVRLLAIDRVKKKLSFGLVY